MRYCGPDPAAHPPSAQRSLLALDLPLHVQPQVELELPLHVRPLLELDLELPLRVQQPLPPPPPSPPLPQHGCWRSARAQFALCSMAGISVIAFSLG